MGALGLPHCGVRLAAGVRAQVCRREGTRGRQALVWEIEVSTYARSNHRSWGWGKCHHRSARREKYTHMSTAKPCMRTNSARGCSCKQVSSSWQGPVPSVYTPGPWPRSKTTSCLQARSAFENKLKTNEQGLGARAPAWLGVVLCCTARTLALQCSKEALPALLPTPLHPLTNRGRCSRRLRRGHRCWGRCCPGRSHP